MSIFAYQFVWWLMIGTVLCLIAVTIGFDLGAAAVMPFLGKNNGERRVMLNAIGSTWAGNQIWLVMGGGTIYVIWPHIYATAFSGFYIALTVFLWAMYSRPIVFEWRAKVTPKWQNRMDWFIGLGSGFGAVALGLLVGNLFLGAPFHFMADMRSVYTGNFFELFMPFPILVGLVSLCMMLMQGASFLRATSDLSLNDRLGKVIRMSSLGFMALFAIAGLWVAFGLKGYQLMYAASIHQPLTNVVQLVTGAWMNNYHVFPWLVIMPAVGFIGAFIAFATAKSEKMVKTFIGSSLATIGAVLTFGGSLFPFLLPSSTNPAHSLTIMNATSSLKTLHFMFVAGVILVPIMLAFNIYIYIRMTHRVTLQEVNDPEAGLY